MMRYIDTASTDPAFNAAVEEILTRRLTPDSPGYLMLWRNRPSVIIGRHQSVTAEVDLRLLREEGIELIRRMSGGGAVYHDLGNVNFSFIVSKTPTQKIEHRDLLGPLIDLFGKLGAVVEMRGKNNLSIVDGGKFSGMASRQMPRKFVLHGTLLFEADLSRLEEALWIDAERYKAKGVASVRMAVTNLRDHLPIDLPTFIEKIKAAYRVEPVDLDEALVAEANVLTDEKYRQRSWNFDQSSPSEMVFDRRFAFGMLRLRLETDKNRLTAVEIADDSSGQIDRARSFEALEAALIGLPADDSRTWADAWRAFKLNGIFSYEGEEVVDWLAGLL